VTRWASSPLSPEHLEGRREEAAKMASLRDSDKISRKIFELGTCSVADLKSALKLSPGDIKAEVASLYREGNIKITGDHVSYKWIGPKEGPIDFAFTRPNKTRKKRTIPPEKKPKKVPVDKLAPDWREKLEQEIIDKIPRDLLGDAQKLLGHKDIEKASKAVIFAGGDYALVADALWICVQVMTNNPPEPSRWEMEIFERLCTDPWIARMYQIKPTRERDNIRSLLLHPDRYNFRKRSRSRQTNIPMFLLLAQLPHLFYMSLKKPVHRVTCAFIRAATGVNITERGIHTLFRRYGINFKKPFFKALFSK
jgi:hypothetical protein